jgi:mannose-1-phosphate guanylyltransferase/phosphomannomutase
MKAVVLAGGYATRLRPISYALPKLLFPVLGKPMIYRTLELLRSIGVDEVVLAVNYLADKLRADVGSNYDGMVVNYSFETEALGTAGPIKLASKTTRLDETFIAMNGDVIAHIDLREMLNQHRKTRAQITDVLHEVRNPERFGVVQLDAENHIRRFVEKPPRKEAPSRLVNAGIYAIEPNVLRMIPDGRKVSLEREIFPTVASQGKLCGFPISGDWFDIGDLSDYRRANLTLLREVQAESTGGVGNTNLAAQYSLRKPIFLGEGAKIGSETVLGPQVIIGKNDSIQEGARISNSILFDRVSVGEGAVIAGSIVGSDVSVGKRVKINQGCIVSPSVRIREGVKIGRGAIIHPYKEIERDVKAGSHVM